MNTNPQKNLVVNYAQHLDVQAIIIVVLLTTLYILSALKNNLCLLHVFGLFIIGLYAKYAIFAAYKNPYLKLNEDGIAIDGYDFIPWHNIAIMYATARYSRFASYPYIAINLKNTNLLKKSKNKLCLATLWLKIHIPFVPQITIKGRLADTSLAVIMDFANHYLPKK